ncbi:hypothetical protein, partial [Xanthomonas hortorum]|uniref:hypothetical protein n=1 Tax=Xanthomonas hortorum TaxID=56454 RepID=UPI003F6E0B32
DATTDQKTTLYSNLYRLHLYPNSGHENVGSATAPDWRYASQSSWSDDNIDGARGALGQFRLEAGRFAQRNREHRAHAVDHVRRKDHRDAQTAFFHRHFL